MHSHYPHPNTLNLEFSSHPQLTHPNRVNDIRGQKLPMYQKSLIRTERHRI
ncbi:hypothetical protein HanIR_Chr15g0771961 [Helianthus annuus]|nr:hypothetical protein HanIR_Chr15g0771961 [Helianthus annuus]